MKGYYFLPGKKPSSRSVRSRINRVLLEHFISLAVGSCRYSVFGINTITNLFMEKRHVICTFWHRELLGMFLFWFRIYRKKRKLQLLNPEDCLVLSKFFTLDIPAFSAAVVSASKDGEIVSHFLEQLGFSVIRGSSGSQGLRAALGVIRYFKSRPNQPACVVMVADGSRGPAGEVQKGIALMAKLTKAVILPCSCAASLAFTVPSWDRMFVPLPFSRIVTVIGTPLDPNECDESELITRIKLSLDDCQQRTLNFIHHS